VKVINNYWAYRTDCKDELYTLIPFYLWPLSFRQKVTSKSSTSMVLYEQGRRVQAAQQLIPLIASRIPGHKKFLAREDFRFYCWSV
jgi:hypothetical protein